MFSALLLSAAVLGVPTGAPAPAAARQDDPAIRLWLSDDGRYQRGDRVKVQVKARDDGYLLVLNVDPDGRLRVLFPLDPGDDSFVRGGKKYEIVGRGGREAFAIADRSGHGTVYAAVSRDPFRFDGYVVGDHWDFGALNDVRMSGRPEGDLNEFVRRLARADFDYDLLGYDIYEHVVYGGGDAVLYDYGPMWYGGYSGWGYGGWGYGGSSIFIGLGFGFPHRRFYSPFFYDPFFYGPFYYPTYYYPAYYYPYPYYYPYGRYPRRPPYYGGYYATPWRQRGGDPLAPGGYQWWRGRDATIGTSATLAAGYRGPFDRVPLAAGRAPTATPVRGTVATTDAGSTRRRSLDMTPARIESAGRQRPMLSPEPARAPEGRRAVDRPERTRSAPQPQRVGPRGDEAREARTEVAERPASPSRAPEARPAGPQIVTPRDRGDDEVPVRRGDDRSGYEGPRIIESGPEARRADDDRAASRPYVEGRRMDASPPARTEARDAPAPRMERRDAPPARREESRSAEPRAREQNDGGGRWAAPAPRGDGGGRRPGGRR